MSVSSLEASLNPAGLGWAMAAPFPPTAFIKAWAMEMELATLSFQAAGAPAVAREQAGQPSSVSSIGAPTATSPCYPRSQLTKKQVCGGLKGHPEVAVPQSPRKDSAMALQVPTGELGTGIASLEDRNSQVRLKSTSPGDQPLGQCSHIHYPRWPAHWLWKGGILHPIS